MLVKVTALAKHVLAKIYLIMLKSPNHSTAPSGHCISRIVLAILDQGWQRFFEIHICYFQLRAKATALFFWTAFQYMIFCLELPGNTKQ